MFNVQWQPNSLKILARKSIFKKLQNDIKVIPLCTCWKIPDEINIILQLSLNNLNEHLPYVHQAKEFAVNIKNRTQALFKVPTTTLNILNVTLDVFKVNNKDSRKVFT